MLLHANKGDIVDIIFPATSCSESEICDIKNYVTNNLGLIPRILFEEKLVLRSENSQDEFPSNDASQRFHQLEAALKSDSKIIWCARGGYGSGDLLPMLENMEPISQNKLFIGFSDIVSIGDFLQNNWGWSVICAPVLTQLAAGIIEDGAQNELKELILGKREYLSYDLEILNPKDNILEIICEIGGGCLSVLTGHFGGRYQTNFYEKILFLEDEGEDGERLDRYFRQLIETFLHRRKSPTAILLGNFLQENIHGTPKAKNIEVAINNLVQRIEDENLAIPVFKAVKNNLGHGKMMLPLVLGYRSKISQKNDAYELVVG
jgi:muramoyltetrapeptide carboxypeptidase